MSHSDLLLASYIDEVASPLDSAFMPVVATTSAAVGALVFGYSMAFTSPANAALEGRYFEVTCVEGKSSNGTSILTNSAGEIEKLFGSISCIGAIAGALLAGTLTSSIGRKGSIVAGSIPFIISYAWMSIVGHWFDADPKFAWEFLVCRALVGISAGLCSVAVPMYIAEVSPPRLRGTLGTVFQFAIVIGIFLVDTVGAYLPHDTAPGDWTQCSTEVTIRCYCDPTQSSIGDWWVVLPWTGLGLSVFLFLLMLFMPKSPRWLVIQGRDEEALATIKYLRGPLYDHAKELEQIYGDSSSPDKATCSDVLALGVRFPLFLGGMLMVFQQFSGINAVIFYGGSILSTSSASLTADKAAMLCQVVSVVFTGVAVILMDRSGRKLLLTISATGMSVCCLLAGLGRYYTDIEPDLDHATMWDSLTLVGALLYFSFFSIGMGAVPWLMVSEMFSSKNVSLASSICTVINWSGAFIVTEIFTTMNEWSSAGTFFIYGGVCASCAVFVQMFLVETKGKSIDEITAHFMSAGNNKRTSVNVV